MDILDINENQNENNEETNIFTDGELIMTESIDKETGKKTIMSGGYRVDSHFLNNGIPIMSTLNSNDTNELIGGGKSTKYETLAVPAGIYFINQKIPKYSERLNTTFENRKVIDENIFDKLFEYAEYGKKKLISNAIEQKAKKNTKKKKHNSINKKTRKAHIKK
jgi:hypothetical protein